MSFPTPYLTRWRSELEQGKRTVKTFDTLWRAACWEAAAAEAPAGSDLRLRASLEAQAIMAPPRGRKGTP